MITEVDAVGSSCYSTTVYVAFTVDGKTADYCRNKEQLLADFDLNNRFPDFDLLDNYKASC